jgi:hypothetical protein
MDDKVVQCFALATSLVSAVAAVLAFTQSGWKNTIRATLLVFGGAGVVYLALIPERHPPGIVFTGVAPLPRAGTQQASWSAPPSPIFLPMASIPSPARPAAAEVAAAPSYARSVGNVPPAATAPVPCIASAAPADPPRASFVPYEVPSRPFPIPAFLLPAGTPKPLPARYPSVYWPSEVLECPHCHTPYSSSVKYSRAVKCPVCSQIVDLLPPGRYFTIHCCCGNWMKSPYDYPEVGPSGTTLQIPYFCPRCRAQGTIVKSSATRN